MANVSLIQSREYAKVYAAGRKRQEKYIQHEELEQEKSNYSRQAMKEIMAALMCGDNNWGITKNGKHEKHTTVDQFAKLADSAAMALMKFY